MDFYAESKNEISIWICFADLFAALFLLAILGLVTILPHYHEVRFSRNLVRTMNQATSTTKQIQERLQNLLPKHLEQPTYSETEIIIPSAALFRSYGFEDYRESPEKLELLGIIRSAIKETLDEAKEQKKFLRVVIEGHTDNVPIKKGAESPYIPTNWELSSRRATGVLRFFEEGGLSSNEYNIVAMGLADTAPVSDNATEEGRAKNRRIVIRIEPDLELIKTSLPETR